MEVLIVPDHPAESEFEDRKSVFLGHLLPVESEEAPTMPGAESFPGQRSIPAMQD